MDQTASRSTALVAGVSLALVAVLAGVGYVLWQWQREPVPEVLPTTPPPEPTTPPAPEPPLTAEAPPLELPPLDESDALIARLVSELSSRPELLAMLLTEGHVRRFVAVVDNVADGVSPKPHLKHVAPTARYEADAVGEGDRFTPRPEAFARYDALVDLFCSLDAAGMSRLYAQTKPLQAEAYRDLGYPDRSFDDTVRRAIRRLLSTPLPPEPVMLGSRGSTYTYADPLLESLTPAQKQLLRLGPRNQRRVQDHLRRLAVELGMRP